MLLLQIRKMNSFSKTTSQKNISWNLFLAELHGAITIGTSANLKV